VPRLATADAQGNSALGLALLLVLGLTLVVVGRAIDHVDALHTRLFEHVQTQRRLASLPPLPAEWSRRERHYVSWIVTWGGALVLGAFAWLIITELINP
jgi:hypothetical protein